MPGKKVNKRTAALRRATQEGGMVDEIVIGDWFHLEMMHDRGSFSYCLIIGKKRLSVIAPKNANKPVSVIDVGDD